MITTHADDVTGCRPRTRPGSGYHVLLADDDYELCDALASTLRRTGYIVDAVRTGIALVNKLASALLDGHALQADAIITDIRMPGCNGLSIVEGLRDSGWDVPIVVITAYGDPATNRRLAGLPAVALLEKPFDGPQLETTLRRLLEQQHG